jgi:hypothetical protein
LKVSSFGRRVPKKKKGHVLACALPAIRQVFDNLYSYATHDSKYSDDQQPQFMTIEEYKALKKKPKSDIALDLLKRLASQASLNLITVRSITRYNKADAVLLEIPIFFGFAFVFFFYNVTAKKKVAPIMKKRGWKVKQLAEFYPSNPSLLGWSTTTSLVTNKGALTYDCL